MRMVKRINATYEQFQEMRQWVLEHCPFGLINDIYDSKNKIAYLYFWDSDYIPHGQLSYAPNGTDAENYPDWSEWIIRPASRNSNEPKVSERYKNHNDEE